MAETTLKTKIALLYKSYAQWDEIKSTYIPLKGEVCFCEVPASAGVSQTEPCVLFKVGDGAKTFQQLPWASALAADVYAWAKKENLEWSDFTSELKESIKEYVGGIETNTLYQIVADGDNKWKLQKSDDKGVTWVDATGVIDMSATVAALNSAIAAEQTRAQAAEATKVDKQVVGTNGTAEIFNESDGGGAHFIHNDGTEAFVGVNDGGESGMMAQIYADKKIDGSWVGSRINVYHNGIYYVSKANQQAGYARNAALMEIATKKDIQDLGQVLHFVGIATKQSGETELEAVERTFPASQQTAGAVAICGNKEFVCAGNPLAWYEFGDVSAYATKAELEAEANLRSAQDTVLQTNITAEATRATAAENALDERLQYFEKAKEPEIKVVDTYTHLYANGISIRIEDNATENMAYYCTAEGVQKTMSFPYGAIVHAGGYGTADKVADFNSGLVIMNGGNVRGIYGGSRGYGNVGVATIVVNGGTLIEGAIGGGAAGNAGDKNSVGLANITLNGGTSLMSYGGGMGLSTVGKVNMLVNGGTHQWITAGGANGTTGSATLNITGGTITCVQAVNRGTIQDATITISGGTITNVYGGGETGDSTVTGKCEKTIFHIEKAFGGNLNKGTYGGVEDASRVTGDYVATTITAAEAAACNLTERKYAGLADIAYSGNVNDLIQSTGDVLILNCN